MRKTKICLSISLLICVFALTSCRENQPVSTQVIKLNEPVTLNTTAYHYELLRTEKKNATVNDGYVLIDSVTAGFDGANLHSLMGKTLEHTTNKELEAQVGVSVNIPLFSSINVNGDGGVRGKYTEAFTIGNISLSGQEVNGLLKDQLVEFYYCETVNTIAVYRNSTGEHITDIYQPSATLDFKVYSKVQNADGKDELFLIKDLGQPWPPTADSVISVEDSYDDEHVPAEQIISANDYFPWHWSDDNYDVDGASACVIIFEQVIPNCDGLRLGIKLSWGEAGNWDVYAYKGDGGWFDKIGSVYVSGSGWCYSNLTFSTRDIAWLAIRPYTDENGNWSGYSMAANFEWVISDGVYIDGEYIYQSR